MEKAVELMSKYGVSEDSLQDGGQYVTVALGDPMRRVPYDMLGVFGLMEDFFSVKYIINEASPLESKGEGLRRFYISGTERNVKIADYVFNTLLRHIDRAWGDYCARNGVDARRVRQRRDFAAGVVAGLRAKLSARFGGTETMAVIHKGDPGLEAFFRRRFPYMRTTRRTVATRDADARSAGRLAAEGMEIVPGIENDGPRLLNGS